MYKNTHFDILYKHVHTQAKKLVHTYYKTTYIKKIIYSKIK